MNILFDDDGELCDGIKVWWRITYATIRMIHILVDNGVSPEIANHEANRVMREDEIPLYAVINSSDDYWLDKMVEKKANEILKEREDRGP